MEREGQKKMVIGNKGEKIKTIGTEARIDMERLFQNKVHLELWVKGQVRLGRRRAGPCAASGMATTDC